MTIITTLTSYSGRIRGSEFWIKGVLVLCVLSISVAVVLSLLFGPPHIGTLGTGWFATCCSALLWFQLPLLFKRVHDTNRSGSTLLRGFIPMVLCLVAMYYTYHLRLLFCIGIMDIACTLFLIMWGFQPCINGTNRFGDDPASDSHGAPAPSATQGQHAKIIPLLLLSVLSCLALGFGIVMMQYFIPKLDKLDPINFELPGITRLTEDIFQSQSPGSSHIAGLLFGGWIWMSLQTCNPVVSAGVEKWNRRWLWASAVLGILLNVLLVLSFLHIISKCRLERGQSRDSETNQVSEDHLPPPSGPATPSQ